MIQNKILNLKSSMFHFATAILLSVNCLIPNFSFSQYTKLHDFDKTNGSLPHSALFSDGTFLYGTTEQGGVDNVGTIFKIKPDGTGFVKLHDFLVGFSGCYPYGYLLSDGTFLYGTTINGGTGRGGAIFKILPDGTGYSLIHSFNDTLGKDPHDLFYDGVFLYGTTFNGGKDRNGTLHGETYGTIFKVKTDGSNFTNLYKFDSINGAHPNGALIFDGGFLYGTASMGGVNNDGTIFKIMLDGTGFTKLDDFSEIKGAHPRSSVVSDGAFLYGMTRTGGASSCGVIFKMSMDGTGYTNLLDLDGLNGCGPEGSLIFHGTFLYGISEGVNSFGYGYGNLFKIKPDGTNYVKLFEFDGSATGYSSYSSPISDGTFVYGMTRQGGNNFYGTIFKYDITMTSTEIDENNTYENIQIYPNPTNGLLNLQLNSVENEQIKICNVLGECVYQNTGTSSNIQIDLSQQPNGVYFVSIQTSTGTVNKKIVVNY